MIDIQQLIQKLQYDPKDPLLFNSSFFVYFLFVFICLYYAFRKNQKARLLIFTFFSLYFFYKASGWFVALVIISAIIDYIVSTLIFLQKSKRRKQLLLLVSIIFNLGFLFYFKYTDFFIRMVNDMELGHFNLLNLTLPIGISFYTFENLSYTIDVYRGVFKPVNSFLEYLFFLSFFPKLVMGPIVRANDFIPQINKPYVVDSKRLATGFYLIVTGLFKKVIISDFINANFVQYVFDDPSKHVGLECLLAVYGYALVIYCDFSGYSDMAIGLARWMGYEIPLNFDSPYQSSSITEFWRRWHMSLSSWLRDYLYISLGGNRKGKIRTYFNLMLTMLLGGFWHGANWNFIFWGFLHGGALAIDKIRMEKFPQKNTTFGWRKAMGIIITFHFVCLCWIFFRASSFTDAWAMIHQITGNFDWQAAGEILNNYKYVFYVMLLGFVLHAIPKSFELNITNRLQYMPVAGFVVIMSIFIWIFIQAKTAEPILPIYLQF